MDVVYLFFEHELLGAETLKHIYDLMPKSRQRKYDAYRFERDKRLCATAYALLLYGVFGGKSAALTPLDIGFGKYGKPFFPSHTSPHFNLSHCDSGAACIVASDEVGLDLQNTVEYDRLLAKAVMSASELRVLDSCANPAKMFTRLWACKESYVKCTGTGIDDYLKVLELPYCTKNRFCAYGYYFMLYEQNDCTLSICCTREVSAEIRELSLQELESFVNNTA